MILKYAIKHNGKTYTPGKYSGGLPKELEKQLTEAGYLVKGK